MKRSHVRSHECLICAIPQMSWFARFCRKKFLLQKRQHFHGEFIFPTFSNWILPQNSAQRCLASQSTLFRSRSDLWNSFSAFLSTISFHMTEYISLLLQAEINSTQGFYIFSISIWSSIISGGAVIVHEDIFIFGSELGEFDIFYKFGNFVFFAKFEELSCFWISNKGDFFSFGREGQIQGPCEYHRSLWKNIELFKHLIKL